MKVILLTGTWDHGAAWASDPRSPFRCALAAHDFEVARSPLTGREFSWPSELGGIPFLNRRLFERVGRELLAFCEFLHFADLNIIAHSHGGNVALWAAAQSEQRWFRTLTTVGTPNRRDVPSRRARAKTLYWQHVYDEKRDLIALPRRVAGQLFDGRVSTDRTFAHVPDLARVPLGKIGHSDILKKRDRIALWRTRGLFDSIQLAGDLTR